MDDPIYVRGLDSSYATSFTDFILSVYCFTYGMNMLYWVLRTCFLMKCNENAKKSGNKRKLTGGNTSSEQDSLRLHAKDFTRQAITVAFAFLSCATMHLLGGLVHFMVPKVAPEPPLCATSGLNTSIASNITSGETFSSLRKPLFYWYVVWQVANVFASLLSTFILLLIPLTIICDFTYLPQMMTKRTDDAKCGGREIQTLSVAHSNCWVKKTRGLLFPISGSLFMLFLSQVFYYGWKIFTYSNYPGESVTDGAVNISSLCPPVEDQDSVPDIMISDLSPMDGIGLFDTLWSMEVAVMLLGLAFCFYSTVATIIAVRSFRMGSANEEKESKKRVYDCDLLEANLSSDALIPIESCGLDEGDSRTDFEICLDDSETENSHDSWQENDGKVKGKSWSRFWADFVSPARCLGSWTIFMSGVIQYSFSVPCGTNDSLNCPFPSHFNHNAVYHCMLILGVSVWYAAEHVHCYQEFNLIRKRYKIQREIQFV